MKKEESHLDKKKKEWLKSCDLLHYMFISWFGKLRGCVNSRRRLQVTFNIFGRSFRSLKHFLGARGCGLMDRESFQSLTFRSWFEIVCPLCRVFFSFCCVHDTLFFLDSSRLYTLIVHMICTLFWVHDTVIIEVETLSRENIQLCFTRDRGLYSYTLGLGVTTYLYDLIASRIVYDHYIFAMISYPLCLG